MFKRILFRTLKIALFRDLIIGIISVAGPAENNEISVQLFFQI